MLLQSVLLEMLDSIHLADIKKKIDIPEHNIFAFLFLSLSLSLSLSLFLFLSLSLSQMMAM